MEKKVGDALKKAVESGPPAVEEQSTSRRSSSVLMNSNRLAIFQLLCRRPCLTLRAILSELDMSRATASWHLKILMNAEYVEKEKVFRRERFCPAGMLPRDEMMPLLSVLNDEKCGPIYMHIRNNPGNDAQTLSEMTGRGYTLSPCLRRLEEIGMITAVKDGRHVRFFPTDKLQQASRIEKSKMKTFHTWLVKRLEQEHLRPEIKELKGGGLIIELSFGNTVKRLNLPYDVINASISEIE